MAGQCFYRFDEAGGLLDEGDLRFGFHFLIDTVPEDFQFLKPAVVRLLHRSYGYLLLVSLPLHLVRVLQKLLLKALLVESILLLQAL